MSIDYNPITSLQTSFIEEDRTINDCESSSTFIGNMNLPIHRWFRYPAGFSTKWVEMIIKQAINQKKIIAPTEKFIVLDPFVGSGTTILESENSGVRGIGFESHPFVKRVASAKLLWRTDIPYFSGFAFGILNKAKKSQKKTGVYSDIVQRCYSQENLEAIDKLKDALMDANDGSDAYQLSWLAFVSILRSTSHAGTAQWQYILPEKVKVKVLNPFYAYEKQIEMMCGDMERFALTASSVRGSILLHDSRNLFEALEDKVDLVITSPPYANNYDYADATRLEMSVLGEINGWGDLQDSVRGSLIRSCSQHVSKERARTYDFLDDPSLFAIRDDIYSICRELDKEKELHGGKKNYHTMVALYFWDLAHVWENLRKYCKKGADVCFVIGDSAPYGVYVPVDELLGRLALSAGFEAYRFVKTRDRNVKWKNRKHRVPLKEGQLWIKG